MQKEIELLKLEIRKLELELELAKLKGNQIRDLPWEMPSFPVPTYPSPTYPIWTNEAPTIRLYASR